MRKGRARVEIEKEWNGGKKGLKVLGQQVGGC